MNAIIQFCNGNSGFISAILSLIGLILSVIAIIVSISTSRLPYKRKAMIKTGVSYVLNGDKSFLQGFNVEIVNVGSLPINISYLGFGWYEQGKVKKLFSMYETHNCKGIIKTADILADCYSQTMFIDLYKTINKDVNIYAIAIDETGKVYKHKYSKLSIMMQMQ